MKNRSLWQSVRVAGRGVGEAARRGVNFRVQLVLLVVTIVFAVWLKISALEWAVVLVVSAGVLALEMVNGALEELADAVVPGHHESVRVAKDMAAGAVLVVCLVALIVGGLIFVPRLTLVL